MSLRKGTKVFKVHGNYRGFVVLVGTVKSIERSDARVTWRTSIPQVEDLEFPYKWGPIRDLWPSLKEAVEGYERGGFLTKEFAAFRESLFPTDGTADDDHLEIPE